MKNKTSLLALHLAMAAALLLSSLSNAQDGSNDTVTFFSYSDIHYGAGEKQPRTKSTKVDIINTLPGTKYPESIGGEVETPRGIIMPGDLINDGGVADKYPIEWADYLADFGVNGEGRCKFPVFETLGNHDTNINLFVFNQIKERNLARKKAGLIGDISPNGYHYSWDWGGIHFVNVNLFGGNQWFGEADAYSLEHHPQNARDFLAEDLKKNIGDSGRPVIMIQHFRPIDDNWWTYSAADKLQKVLQDYNVIAIMVGHQGGGVNNVWRGINWISSNGELIVARISADNRFVALSRSAKDWGQPFEKKIFRSYESSGLPAAVNNGDWVSNVTESGATVSGKLLYSSASPARLIAHWGTVDGGTNAENWQNSKEIGEGKKGEPISTDITGLQPWTSYYYRCSAVNEKGEVWAADSIPFVTKGVLPKDWQTKFIGYEQRPWGGANFDNGVFTVRGSGRDIGESWQKIDNFQFAYKEIEGDCEIKARITTMQVNSREPKSGIMLREELSDSSKSVSMLLISTNGGVRMFSRTKTGGSTSMVEADKIKAPCWVKIIRKGNTFSGFASSDGVEWKQAGDDMTIEMPGKIYAGLAVTAGNRDGSRIHSSDFDNVSIDAK